MLKHIFTFIKKIPYLSAFLMWRGWLYVLAMIAILLVPARLGYEYTRWLPSEAGVAALTGSSFIWSAANFDGVHYLNIARNGYHDQARFLPLYPILIFLAQKFLFFYTQASWSYFIAAQLISWSSFLGSIFLLTKLITKSKSDITKVVIVLLFFPTSFFFVFVYSESLFLFLFLLALRFLQTRKYGWMYLVLSLLCVTRLTGLMVWVALTLSWLLGATSHWPAWSQVLTKKHWSSIVKEVNVLFFAATALVPLSVYAYFNQVKWGDWTYFVKAHTFLANARSQEIVWPWIVVGRYLRILMALPISQFEWWVALLEILSLGLVVWVLWRTFMNKSVTFSWWLTSVMLIAMPLLSGTLSGLPRYLLPVFIIYIYLASVKKPLFYVWILLSSFIQILLLAAFINGYFIA